MDSIKERVKSYFGKPAGYSQSAPNSPEEFESSNTSPVTEALPPIYTTVDYSSSAPPSNPRQEGNSTQQERSSQSGSWSLFGNRQSTRQRDRRSSSNRGNSSRQGHNSPVEHTTTQRISGHFPVSELETTAYQRPPSVATNITVQSPMADGQMSPQQQNQTNIQDYRFPVDKPITIRFVPYNPYFPTIEKEMMNGACLNIGRYQRSNPRDDPYCEGIYFRSTVVSRKHAQLFFQDGEFFIRDTKSLGGTFINSTRISQAGKESPKCKIFHGDVIQFGVDYRPDQRTGQVRNKDKCVEVLVEFPQVLKKKKKGPKPSKWDPTKHTFTECCICISALYLKQAIFIAPCAHTFHYRCIAPLLRGKGFNCPMCRQDSDLHESVWSLDDGVVSEDSSPDTPGKAPYVIPEEKIDADDDSSNQEVEVETQQRNPGGVRYVEYDFGIEGDEDTARPYADPSRRIIAVSDDVLSTDIGSSSGLNNNNNNNNMSSKPESGLSDSMSGQQMAQSYHSANTGIETEASSSRESSFINMYENNN